MLEKIEYIAKEAGKIIRRGFSESISVEYKTNLSNIVTNIDRAAERKIIDFVNSEFPAHGIIAEESGSADEKNEYVWIIDPLDGTTNFAHRLPIFSVSIGVQKNGELIYGVVYDVMRDVVYKAEKGSGAFENGKKIHVGDNSDLRRSLLATGFPYDIDKNPNRAIEKFNAFLVEARGIRRLGSAALDLCLTASGVFDGFWEVFLNPWDIAAGMLLLEEAGGKITNFAGEKINIYSRQILATNGRVHKKMIEILQMHDKEQ